MVEVLSEEVVVDDDVKSLVAVAEVDDTRVLVALVKVNKLVGAVVD